MNLLYLLKHNVEVEKKKEFWGTLLHPGGKEGTGRDPNCLSPHPGEILSVWRNACVPGLASKSVKVCGPLGFP